MIFRKFTVLVVFQPKIPRFLEWTSPRFRRDFYDFRALPNMINSVYRWISIICRLHMIMLWNCKKITCYIDPIICILWKLWILIHILPSSSTLGVAHCSNHIQEFSTDTWWSRAPRDLFSAKSFDSFCWCRRQAWRHRNPNESATQINYPRQLRLISLKEVF